MLQGYSHLYHDAANTCRDINESRLGSFSIKNNMHSQLPYYYSSPPIYSRWLMWMVHSQGFMHSLHYRDNFLLIRLPGTLTSAKVLHSTLQFCDMVGLQVADEKTEGPSTTITFLGIDICLRKN